jgi:hypothetical protein
MALTVDLETVTLTGTYVDIIGDPVAGSVTFTPQTIIKDTDQNQIIVNNVITEVLDAQGSFSVVLPVTDDSDVTPQPFAYLVEEVFSGGRSFVITLPGGGASVDIADLSPAVSAAVAAAYVTSAQYNAINTRLTTANTAYTQVTAIQDNIDAAATAAASAASAATGSLRSGISQFLLMGV